MLVRMLMAIDDSRVRSRLQRLLSGEDVDVELVRGRSPRWDRFVGRTADMLLVSQSLVPDPIEQHLAEVGKLPNQPGVMVLVDRVDPAAAARYQAAGAEAVLYEGLPDDLLREAMATPLALRTELITRKIAARRSTAQPQFSDFVRSSPAMEILLRTARQVVDSDVPLLVLGETGVGKERLARAIHAESSRSVGPFISVNCGAVPEHLIESELFGHDEGAFTGATRPRRGCFEMAHRGTIFLDEIGEMPLNLQVKLLHVLQDLELRPVGSERTISVDVRVMAATNRDILAEVTQQRFRRDLYYRLSVVKLELPPLRERVADIPVLVESFVEDLGKRVGRTVDGITPEATQALCRYAWPGNVRELINVIERAILLCPGLRIGLEDLPEEIGGGAADDDDVLPPGETGNDETREAWLNRPLKEVRDEAVATCEKRYLAGLLALTGGRIDETARRAGIEPRSLYDKMKRHGLRKEDFKPGRATSP